VDAPQPIKLIESIGRISGSLGGVTVNQTGATRPPALEAVAAMSLLPSARINGHAPYAYQKDVLQQMPTHPACRIDELLPDRCTPVSPSRR
jgi:hypothetical protein